MPHQIWATGLWTQTSELMAQFSVSQPGGGRIFKRWEWKAVRSLEELLLVMVNEAFLIVWFGFWFLEIRFLCVVLTVLNGLELRDLPPSASQRSGIKGMYHHLLASKTFVGPRLAPV